MFDGHTSDVSIVILAAGKSSRLGRDKLSELFGGRPLFRIAIDTSLAAGCRKVVFVTSREFAEQHLSGASLPESVIVVINEQRDEGISSSIRKGLEYCADSGAVLLMVADQPFVTAPLLSRIMCEHMKNRGKIIACCVNGRFRNPALFPSEYFPLLRGLKGETGGSAVMAASRSSVVCIEVDDVQLRDIDTQDDIEILRRVSK